MKHAAQVNDMFMAHAQLEKERATLTHVSLRSATGGARRPAARAEAAKGHGLSDAHASKGQRQATCVLALAEAGLYANEDLCKRGEGSIASELKRKREDAARSYHGVVFYDCQAVDCCMWSCCTLQCNGLQ